MPPPQQQANNSSQLQATSGSSAEAPATQPVAQDPIHPQQGSRGALMKFGKVIPIQSPRTEMPPAYKTRRPPPPPTAVQPQTLRASAAQPAEERYQPNVTIQDTNHSPHWLLKFPANIIRNTANQSPTTPAHNHPATSLAVRAHNSSCQRHPACPRLSNCTSEQARHEAGD